MYENKEKQQTALLAAVDTGEFDVQRSVDELEELAKSAGAVVKGRVIQRKERPDPATLMALDVWKRSLNLCGRMKLIW